MKLRNLFLASLAAMAMVSCSNEVEGVDNNGAINAEKNAKLQFNIGFPSASGTRADAGFEEGSVNESAIKTVNVRVSYSEGTANDIFNFRLEDFEKNGNVYSLKKEKVMSVAPSAGATLYVTVNGDETVNLNGTVSAEYDATASISTGIAENGNFLMSGKSEKPVKIEKNSAGNTATVTVDRVVARIDEITQNLEAEFTFETDYRNTEGAVVNTEKISMTAEVVDYAIYNLNKNSNIFFSQNFAAPSYFQEFLAKKENKISYDNFVNKAIGSTNTYTLENNSSSMVTSVIYKVQYKYDNAALTGDFFTFAKDGKTTVLYKDFDSLDKDNGYRFSKGFGLTKDSKYDDFIAAGVSKYEDGFAYYTRPIKTGTDEIISRNNCYKLLVTKIGSIGKAVIDEITAGEPTLLELTVQVKDWTVNMNEIEL